ncbi:MAG: GNAT family N-acetyltransferase [Treponema sp.]|nr:GNAT family N-acetyltransferase [Treponema sp.]
MNGEWQRIKNNSRDIIPVLEILAGLEDDYVSACSRFEPAKYPAWALKGKNDEIHALIVNSRSTIIPVFRDLKEIPFPKFLGGYFLLKKIYSVQGLKEEVIILEKIMSRLGKIVSDIFDYDLMEINSGQWAVDSGQNGAGSRHCPLPSVILRKPQLVDMDALAPLQAAYEKEEVLGRGSVFSPAASRINLSNIVANGKILAAEINGKIVGKINVNGISYTKYQVGGVYVHPDFRGKGIGRYMASAFISSLLSEGKGITLFVKKTNIAAKKLYASIGFKVRGDYRITYY